MKRFRSKKSEKGLAMTNATIGSSSRRRTTTRRSTVLVCVLAVLAAGLATAAAANTLERTETFTVDISGTDRCKGFKILASGTLTVRVTTYFDSGGAPIKIHVHASRDQTLTNSVSGKAIDLRGSVLVVVDLQTGWETWLGQVIMSNDRGVGSVIQDTGKIVFDSDGNPDFIAGPHDAITNPEVVCAALA